MARLFSNILTESRVKYAFSMFIFMQGLLFSMRYYPEQGQMFVSHFGYSLLGAVPVFLLLYLFYSKQMQDKTQGMPFVRRSGLIASIGSFLYLAYTAGIAAPLYGVLLSQAVVLFLLFTAPDNG